MASAKTTKAKKETPAAAPKAAAKAKAGAKAAPAISTAALQHGESAFGARYKKPGFAFTPEDDLAFALGYPHFVSIADGHPDDADAEAKAAVYPSEQGLAIPVWPREIAHRVARSFAFDDAAEIKKAVAVGGPVSEDEARALVKRDLNAPDSWRLLFLLEALVGPSVVLDAAIGQLEAYTEPQWRGSGRRLVNVISATSYLGYLLLRLPEAESQRQRARLEALYGAWATDAGFDRASARKALDVLLHGKEGAERSAYKPDKVHISTQHPLYVLDDPAWILRVVRDDDPDVSSTPDPRLAFLGGEEALAIELGRWKKYTKSGAHAQLVERFGRIKSPLILPWMLEMSATSKAKSSATAWFVAHADTAREFLEKTAKGGGNQADWAKAILAKLR